jgi:TonB family protein
MTSTALLEGLAALGTATLSPLWLPLLAWTALALPLWLGLQQWRPHPLVAYRSRQVLLAALPLGLVAGALFDAGGWLPVARELVSSAAAPASGTAGAPSTLGVASPASPGPSPAAAVAVAAGALAVAAAGAALPALARWARDVVAHVRFRHGLDDGVDRAWTQEARRVARALGVGRPVRAVRTEGDAVPMTVGGPCPALLLPARLDGDDARLRMTLEHELVHVRRYDDLAAAAERFVAALFAAHPLVHRLKQEIDRTRETACDAAVLEAGTASAPDYARLLLAFADAASASRRAALSLSESPSSLTTRVEAMLDRTPSPSPRLLAGTLTALLIGLSLGIAACSDGVAPPTEAPADDAPEAAQTTRQAGGPSSDASPGVVSDTSDVYVAVEEEPTLVGGMEALQQHVTYPEFARKAGIEGRVIVQFILGRDGSVLTPHVVTRKDREGPHRLLREAAVDAVQKAEFRPGRIDGEPVQVKMSLPVTFKLPKEG